MALLMWTCYIFTLFLCTVAKENNVRLVIKPHQNNNIKVFETGEIIDYVCEAENFSEIPYDGVSLYWYRKQKDASEATLEERNDNVTEKRQQLLLRYKVYLTPNFDWSEIYCAARAYDNDVFKIVGKSEGIQLILNKSYMKMLDIVNNNERTKNAPIKMTVGNNIQENLNNGCDNYDKSSTALIVVSVIATVIILVLVLFIVLSKRNQRAQFNGTSTNSMQDSYSHTNSTYMWETCKPEVVSTNNEHDYAEPILPKNKLYANC